MKRLALVLAVVGLMASWAGSASAFTVGFNACPGPPCEYDNTPNTVTAGPTTNYNQTTGVWRDIFWYSLNNAAPRVGSADYINAGNSLTLQNNAAAPGPGPIQALNFTGPSVSGGQSYLSIYDTTPADGATTRNLFSATGGLTISADVLFVKHSTSAGVVALYSEGQDALALLANDRDGNNTDFKRVSLIFQSPGSGIELASISLPSGTFCTADSQLNGGVGCTDEEHWYRVVMNLTVNADNSFDVLGSFYNQGTTPGGALGTLITSLTFHGSSYLNPDGSACSGTPGSCLNLANPGEVGVIAMGNESISLPDNVGVSVNCFEVSESGGCTPVPEPATMFLGGLGLIAFGYAARRRLFA